ncbi:hypothetical protein AVEN_248479-1, partial [Araneus ventricosus]
MPPNRQNISRRTNAAKRKRVERQNETEEETAQRNDGNALHMSQSHATESSQQHEARNEASRLASRSEKTKSSMNYDRCISFNATRAKSQELKYFRFPKDEE